MLKLLSSLVDAVSGRQYLIPVNARVNRSAGLTSAEKIDGRVLKIDGDLAQVCWPRGEKTREYLGDLVVIAE
ncbi:hypothetical protein [Chitinilyticum litopenaei]|uniref:hypothetical protein n=1 Tax=Chitinilyticum litopenaei TaxID=1121276 RepID=UPI00041AB14D|nr:hypothetical protein [Chitinilyticum litopenaei]